MQPEQQPLREADGFLFIGDPHLCSKKPGRRKDADFAATVLGKIQFCIELCNERSLVPVFLGDMFDRPVEVDEGIKTKLIRILRRSWTTPLANTGNHDLAHAVLTDSDSLMGLAESGVLKVQVHSGAFETFLIRGKRIGLGATPYGQDAPTDARPFFGQVDTIFWLTHHDMAFENPYPGSIAPFEIQGCRIVVNGHMHLSKRFAHVGRTIWVNPGNLTRQHIDAIDHVPTAWALSTDGKFEKIVVPHEKAPFDLTGKLIDTISPGQAPKATSEGEGVEAVPGVPESAFVSMLRNESSMDMEKSADGTMLLEDIAEKFERERTAADVRSIIMGLHAKATRQAA